MPNQYINKVIYGGRTLIDLTSDTVEASKLLLGTKAHDKSGAQIEGTCTLFLHYSYIYIPTQSQSPRCAECLCWCSHFGLSIKSARYHFIFA